MAWASSESTWETLLITRLGAPSNSRKKRIGIEDRRRPYGPRFLRWPLVLRRRRPRGPGQPLLRCLTKVVARAPPLGLLPLKITKFTYRLALPGMFLEERDDGRVAFLLRDAQWSRAFLGRTIDVDTSL